MFNPFRGKSGLIVRSADLYNAEPPLGQLVSDYVTPQSALYVRSHGEVALADVLRAADAEDGTRLHVAFSALDVCGADGERFRFSVSIPMAKATSPEVLLAFKMNGEALTPEHGFPLRAVVPGFAGVRSAKWLAEVSVQDRPSDAKPQARDCKMFPPHVRKETADWDKGITHQRHAAERRHLRPGTVRRVEGWTCHAVRLGRGDGEAGRAGGRVHRWRPELAASGTAARSCRALELDFVAHAG